MKRRQLLKGAAAFPFFTQANATPFSRVRPGQPGWPSDAAWEGFGRAIDGRLAKVRPSLDACRVDPVGEACRDLFRELKNPYFIGDDPSLTQTMGWVDAWTSQPSTYAVAARSTRD